MSTYLITGTSRGIGLELVKQLIALPAAQVAKIFAVTRSPSEGLQQLIVKSEGRVVNIIIDDISKESSAEKGVAEVKRHGAESIDVLVNNAGIMPFAPSIRDMSGDSLRDTLNVNLVSAHVMTLAFFPLLQKGREKKVINISTTMGSIAMTRDYSFAPTQAYKISKAGMNMLNAQWAMEFEKEGFTFLAVSPGVSIVSEVHFWFLADLIAVAANRLGLTECGSAGEHRRGKCQRHHPQQYACAKWQVRHYQGPWMGECPGAEQISRRREPIVRTYTQYATHWPCQASGGPGLAHSRPF
ncbi:putative oxidoreductase [Pseudocercospora fuligena]|uniref:Putative oxidoreductase n=1 Tax=Pseudocercospora fuligena TaxID=685502 RepID=A0A8H6RMZ8_9PEZI|nr:putative oxidoreductase [Pseudocercospora fuligena]